MNVPYPVPVHAVFLDPGYRISPKDVRKPFCERCARAIKDTSKAIRVTTLDMQVWRDTNGAGWLGADCAKIIGLSEIEDGSTSGN